MTGSTTTVADSALAELLEVSPQVDAAIIVRHDDGTVLAGAPATGGQVATQLAEICTKMLHEAEQSRSALDREPVTQIEVASADGHVFIVTDATCFVAAVTDADPTVGLVFYDLKTALRTVREAKAEDAPATSHRRPAEAIVTPVTASSSDAADAESSASRWRRRKS